MADDAELRLKLTQFGVDVGPITEGTRALYRRMLRKRQNDQQASALGSAAKKLKSTPRSTASSTTPSSSSRVAKSKSISRSARATQRRKRVSGSGAGIIPGASSSNKGTSSPKPKMDSKAVAAQKPSSSSLLQDREHSEATPPPRIYPVLPPVSIELPPPPNPLPPSAPPFQPIANPPSPVRPRAKKQIFSTPSVPQFQPPYPVPLPSQPRFQQRPSNTPPLVSPSRSNSQASPSSPPLPRQQRQAGGSNSLNPPSSPLSSSSSTSSTDSGVVNTITGWLGSRVKGILNRIQEAASPSPRRPLSSKPVSPSSSSPSSPVPSAPPPQKSPQIDSISIDELDFAYEPGSGSPGPGSPGPVYLQAPSKDPLVGVPKPAISPHHSRPQLPSHNRGGIQYDWELTPEDVQICKQTDGELWLLGKGGCGQVYRGLKDSVDDVAVKVIRLQPSSEPHTVTAQFKQEIDTISRLRHRHVLQFYGACIQPSCLFMVTELMDTDLFSALREPGTKYTWTGEYGGEVLLGIASGLHHLHSRRPPIVHRDIKSPNILVIGGLAKIADVGIANTMAATDMTAQRGFTIAWAAPEVILRKRANEKIDIWSLGIILWEVVSGRVPRPGQLVLPASAPPHLRTLYDRCTSDNPNLRPSAADIIHCLKHP